MCCFDSIIIRGMGEMLPSFSFFDHAIFFLSQNKLVKVGLIAAAFWWLWLRKMTNSNGRVNKSSQPLSAASRPYLSPGSWC